METYKLKNGKTLEILQDESPESPREWDNMGTMICFRSRYNLGDKHNYSREEAEELSKGKDIISLPLYLYDHSGITISTSDFGDRWDSGCIGFVIIEEKQWKTMMGDDMDKSEERLERIIDGEVETYDTYLRGDVYQYKVYEVETCSLGHKHKTLVESCGSYFSEEDCRTEGEGVIESLLERNKNLVS